MGNQCSNSLVLATPVVRPDTCGVLNRALPDEDGPDCGLCGDDLSPSAPLTGPHPLLLDQLTQGDGTPRTPRGPMPPWAVSPDEAPIDLTATGPTPPRSPTPPRATPPGLPDEDASARDQLTGSSLSACFDQVFLQDLFKHARTGNTNVLGSMLHQVNGGAFTLVCNMMGGGGPPGALSAPASSLGTAMAAERREKSAEMVASFLSQVRASAGRETLLGAAASGGHLEAVQLLLSSRADPSICDDHGCSALHRAAESGRLLTVLLVLDRLQATNRAISVAELTNADGETPEMFAALAGASDVCRAFEVFNEMQNDAEERQLGCSTSTSDFAGSGYRGANAGSLLAFLDLAADSHSAAGTSASSLLLRSAAGNGLARDIFRRVPEDEVELSQLVDQTCHGIRAAEEYLLSTAWNPTDQGLDPAVRTFMRTAEVRSTWQKLRIDAVRSEGVEGLDDFWQTHVHSEMMVATLMNARGDTFQLLLTVLWLYTREAWLRHTVDTLAGALCAASGQSPGSTSGNWAAADGTTGGTTLCGPDVPTSMQPLQPLVQALAPLMQLVQSALAWFEEAGIRHSGMTYRPLSLPMLGLQRLIDRYIAARREGDGEDGRASQESTSLISGAWVALGAGSFFSAISSRADAIKRMTRTRCNVLLVVRPDEQSACFPKQMSLRGNGVDDVLFPLGCVFRITRITRTVSSDLDPDSCRGTNVRWPVMIFELAAANKFLDVLELLERRGDLGPGSLETRLQEWVDGAPAIQQHERMLAAGELIMRCCKTPSAHVASVHSSTGGGGYVSAQHSRSSSRSEKAASFLQKAASLAEAANEPGCVAHALLALARCNISSGFADPDQVTVHGKKAIALLTECNGANHPETCAARAAWRELGVAVKNPA